MSTSVKRANRHKQLLINRGRKDGAIFGPRVGQPPIGGACAPAWRCPVLRAVRCNALFRQWKIDDTEQMLLKKIRHHQSVAPVATRAQFGSLERVSRANVQVSVTSITSAGSPSMTFPPAS